MNIEIILPILIIVAGGFYYIKFLRKQNAQVTYETSPFHHWNIDELNKEKVLVPWNEVFKSRLATVEELKSIGLNNINDDILIVYYSSPKHYWDNLAGQAGYLFINKTDKKQVDFITTIIG
jgi:hypothetical protein